MGANQVLISHPDNTGAYEVDRSNFRKKAMVVARGKLYIQALSNPSYPTWVKIKSIDKDNLIFKVGTTVAKCWFELPGNKILITNTIHMEMP